MQIPPEPQETSQLVGMPVQHPELPATPSENPPWGIWDVVVIFLFAILMLIVWSVAVTSVCKLTLYPQTPFMKVMAFPLVSFVAQVFAYLSLLGFMVSTVKKHSQAAFWPAIRWNWPTHGIWALIVIGLVSYAVLVGVAFLLPRPGKSPFEEFFKRPVDAYAVAILAISIGPFLEEVLFRGFLYPALARRLGVASAIVLTAVPFALMHYPEYASWSPVFLVFLIGVVLTIVRAKKGSVAASFIVHAVYNGVQMAIAFVDTQGFRHLERLTK